MIPLRDNYFRRTYPLTTHLLIVANIAVFVYMLLLSPASLDNLVQDFSLVPARFQLLNLFTFQFLHAGFLHIGSNMIFLHSFGDSLEDKLGHLRFFIFYLLSGAMAGLVQYFVNPDSPIPVLGASGAVAGAMGAYLVLLPKSKIDVLLPLFPFFPIVTIPAFTLLVYWFLTQLLQGVGSIDLAVPGGIAYFAHIGGFVFGVLLSNLFPP